MGIDLGQQVVTCVLDEQDVKPFTDCGWDLAWVTDPANIYRHAVFPEHHAAAWQVILRHCADHGQPPTREIFLQKMPGYVLADDVAASGEIIEIASDLLRKMAASLAVADLQALRSADDYDAFSVRCLEAASFIRDLGRDAAVVQPWDGAGQDVEALLSRKVPRGIGTGIGAVDDQECFTGFRPGNLVTYLGRAKAGKTSLALKSALGALREHDKRVLFVTVEISAQDIHDRLDAFDAGVSLTRLQLGKLTDAEKDKVRRVYRKKEKSGRQFYVVQPAGKYTVTSLQSDVERYMPDYVVVDGFYFMTDRVTGKLGAHWEGHDNLAQDLKRLAMDMRKTVLVTHQVREKQLGGKKGAGIDDGAMMGGTGLIMASDMVAGLDVGKVTCTRSRSQYFKDVCGEWDWETCTFKSWLAEEEYEGEDAAAGSPG